MAKIIELTEEAFKSCREKPTFKLITALMEKGRGEEIIVEGEDQIMRYEVLLDILTQEGFEVVEKERKPGRYRVRAVRG